MSNDEVYAAGLLNRALDLATQPPEIQAFLRVELDLLLDVITEGMRVIDVGCGTGRHLFLLRDRLSPDLLAVAKDIAKTRVDAKRRGRARASFSCSPAPCAATRRRSGFTAPRARRPGSGSA